MEAETLLNSLKEIQMRAASRDLLLNLPERKKKELEFHNLHRDKSLEAQQPEDTYEMLYGNKKYYSTVQLSREYVDQWIQSKVPGKIFLDYACGNGDRAIQAAKAGAKLAIGLDISDVSVGNASSAAESQNLADKCFFVQGDCENTGLPSDSIDVILCSGMLHHLDLSYAFPELRRILKPGGVILGVEALDYNPVIKLYRTVTPSMRTDWEKKHILSMKDIRFAKRFFNIGEVKFWHLFSILGAFFKRSEVLKKLALGLLNTTDRVLLKIPGVRLMSWQFTFELIKPTE
jgi:SAM-dependent methyltransferase